MCHVEPARTDDADAVGRDRGREGHLVHVGVARAVLEEGTSHGVGRGYECLVRYLRE